MSASPAADLVYYGTCSLFSPRCAPRRRAAARLFRLGNDLTCTCIVQGAFHLHHDLLLPEPCMGCAMPLRHMRCSWPALPRRRVLLVVMTSCLPRAHPSCKLTAIPACKRGKPFRIDIVHACMSIGSSTGRGAPPCGVRLQRIVNFDLDMSTLVSPDLSTKQHIYTTVSPCWSCCMIAAHATPAPLRIFDVFRTIPQRSKLTGRPDRGNWSECVHN